jgi:hypothetical protein
MSGDSDSEQQRDDFPAGMPIYDCHGEELGVVSTAGLQEQYLIMTEGRLFHRDVPVPASAIARSDASGIYLNRTREEIHDLTLGGWSSLGDVDLNTGMPAGGGPAGADSAAGTGPDDEPEPPEKEP